MKVVKPMKAAVLTRVVVSSGSTELHLAVALGFNLLRPRDLVDELRLWSVVQSQLGENGVLDECVSKARGEVFVAGCFNAPLGSSVCASYVRFQVGSVEKRLAVLGNRYWRDGVPTEPQPFKQMPIDWHHAYGGPGFPRNPHGVGHAPIARDGALMHPLPNVEQYGQLVRTPSERPDPAGCLPMDLAFAQRLARAGTYGRRWLKEFFPGFPPDLAPTFFNAAPEDQWIEGFWRTDDAFVVENMHPERATIEGRLPGLVARAFVTRATSQADALVEVPMRCDTVWLFPTAELGVVIFHGSVPVVSDDAADLAHLVVACEDPETPRQPQHYMDALARRLDKDEGALAGLSDSDLMPSRSSGVSPNIGELEIGRWVKSENLAQARVRNGAVRERENARALVVAEGLDPKDYDLDAPLPETSPPPPENLDDLAAYIKTKQVGAETMRREAEDEEARAKELARQQYAEMGLDYDEEMSKGLRENAGPPRFSALEHVEHMLAEVHQAREQGVPLEALEQQLSDPDYQAQLLQQEQSLRETYRTGAHLDASPFPMSPEATQQARVIVQAALDTGESLADRDFTGVDLSGMNLAGIDLRGAFLEASNLEGCDFEGAQLERAVFAKAVLKGANLKGARLAGANLGATQLREAVLDGADMTQAILSRAELGGASFKNVTLAEADLLFTKFEGCDLSGASLPGVNILNADLSGCSFVGADLSDANFVECTLDRADFSRAKLHKTTFVTGKGQGVSFREASFGQGIVVHGSELPGADFSDADMQKSNLRGTVLTGAKLDRAQLQGADISECDCTGASLERVVLTGGMAIRTKLTRASLRGANLMDVLMSKAHVEGADFTGANLARADLSRVHGDGKTSFAEAEVAQVRFLPKADPQTEGGAA